MTQRIFVDRSRYESAQRCLRARWYGYHQSGMGIQSSRMPLPLAVGSSVHVGLAQLLREGQGIINSYPNMPIGGGAPWREIEEEAVLVALADFAQYQHALDAPDAELAILATIGNPTVILNADSVAVANVRNEFDEYLFREQSALVEGLVRAYARRRLRPLLEQFEVLEVEREGEWELSPRGRRCTSCGAVETDNDIEYDKDCRCGGEFNHSHVAPALWFMSRPDALLRDRESNQLYLLSYKTTGAWDLRKTRDAEHDMQGMSEGIEIERRLADWWAQVKATGEFKFKGNPADYGLGDGGWASGKVVPNHPLFRMRDYLASCDAPPRILAVRYEYLLKGERWKDKELSARFGVEMRSQKSHLIRAYEAVSVPMRGTAGFAPGDLCWSWDYIGEDGKQRSLAWQNWKSRGTWEIGSGNLKAWIDMLDDAAETMSGEDSTMGMPPRLLGYKCDAQAVGLTAQHPLDAVFVPPITVYRNDDDIRDMVDQMESQERRIAEGVAAVNSARDEGERRHALNVYFPQTRRACEYPTTCAFSRVCYGSEDIRRDPLGSGLYKIRRVNHPQEQGGNGNG
jgi:hypothetical protein